MRQKGPLAFGPFRGLESRETNKRATRTTGDERHRCHGGVRDSTVLILRFYTHRLDFIPMYIANRKATARESHSSLAVHVDRSQRAIGYGGACCCYYVLRREQ